MPRTRLSKIDLEAKVYKLKTELYDGKHQDKTGQWLDGAHHALSEVLKHLQEYSH